MIELPIKVSKKIDLKDKNIHQKTEKTYNDLKKQFLTEDEEAEYQYLLQKNFSW